MVHDARSIQLSIPPLTHSFIRAHLSSSSFDSARLIARLIRRCRSKSARLAKAALVWFDESKPPDKQLTYSLSPSNQRTPRWTRRAGFDLVNNFSLLAADHQAEMVISSSIFHCSHSTKFASAKFAASRRRRLLLLINRPASKPMTLDRDVDRWPEMKPESRARGQGKSCAPLSNSNFNFSHPLNPFILSRGSPAPGVNSVAPEEGLAG